MKWFQNLRCATSMDERTYSTDFSFQIAIALQNFADNRSVQEQGRWASEFKLAHAPIARGELMNDVEGLFFKSNAVQSESSLLEA